MAEKNKFDKLTLLKKSDVQIPASPDEVKLEVFENTHQDRDYWITFECPEFTSHCPITNQPDFGKIIIRYIPDQFCIESKSLKLYLFSFRNYGTFHEEAVNRILDDMVAACKPRHAVVVGEFNPRGGISIKVDVEYKSNSK